MPIAPAQSDHDIADVRTLMTEYGETLDVRDRCFQNMDAELAGLPGAYAPPTGALLIARDGVGRALGCVALKRFDDGVCEMKRLYVPPAGQGQGLGRRLVEALIAEARQCGYRAMRLDTLETMQAARALYATLGFRPIAAYNANPVPGISYLDLEL